MGHTGTWVWRLYWSRVRMKTACDLDESVFMRVDDTARNAFPRCINDRTSSYRIGSRVKENMIVWVVVVR